MVRVRTGCSKGGKEGRRTLKYNALKEYINQTVYDPLILDLISPIAI